VTWPPNRVGATKADGGDCTKGQCSWFSQIAQIPGEPTLPERYRTNNINSHGVHDMTRKNPWRSPGAAPVHGSGCAISGGGPALDGTYPAVQPGTFAGQDGASLPRKEPTVWTAGSVQEVAWAINGNHNGGYSWRLCKNNAPKVPPRSLPNTTGHDVHPRPLSNCTADPAGKTSTCRKCSETVSWSCELCREGCTRSSVGDGNDVMGTRCVCDPDPKDAVSPEPIDPDVTEECFQQNVLKFATDSSWIEFPNGTRIEFPLTKVTEGTYPAGSEWARNPIPTCLFVDRYDTCGPVPAPTGFLPDQAYLEAAWCSCYANGRSVFHVDDDGLSRCPAGIEPNYPPLAGITGYGYKGGVEDAGGHFPWSIVDKMQVPENLPTGDYLLSWRWDTEQGPQVWQGCADLYIEGADNSQVF